MTILSAQYQTCTGLVSPIGCLDDKCKTPLSSSPGRNDDNGKVFVSAINFPDNQITLNIEKDIAHFDGSNETPANNLFQIDPQISFFAKISNSDVFEGKLNEVFQVFPIQKIDIPTGRPPLDHSELLFSTPETCIVSSFSTPFQGGTYDQILQLLSQKKCIKN